MPAMPDRDITIASGQTASAAFGTGQAKQGSFQIPAAFTGTTVTFKVSNDGVTFTNCPVEGNESVTPTITAGGTYSFPQKFFNFRYGQLVSGSAEGAARTIPCFMRD